jgi:hypothetical protein
MLKNLVNRVLIITFPLYFCGQFSPRFRCEAPYSSAPMPSDAPATTVALRTLDTSVIGYSTSSLRRTISGDADVIQPRNIANSR